MNETTLLDLYRTLKSIELNEPFMKFKLIKRVQNGQKLPSKEC